MSNNGWMFATPTTEAGAAAGLAADAGIGRYLETGEISGDGAEEAVGLYLEFLGYGHAEDCARARAVNEVTEGMSVDVEAIEREMAEAAYLETPSGRRDRELFDQAMGLPL